MGGALEMDDTFEQRTIREHLLGMVANHLGGGAINCGVTHQVGCELVSLLAAYREEERRLFPQVYLIGPGEADLLRALAPGSTPLSIGESQEADGARQAAVAVLKNCAALAIDGWCIYVRRRAGGFDFGLFRPSAESYSAGAEEALTASGLPAALLRHSAENTVEIINGNGGRLEISLTTAMPSNRAMSSQISEFAAAACSDVAKEARKQAAGYLARVLTDCLRGGHGSLLAAVPHKKKLDRKKLSDGVVLAEPIPLVQTMLAAVSATAVAEASLLRSQESLLRGMMASDGVTVLGTDGSIRAFRIFVQKTDKSPDARRSSPGGARSRAFAVLRTYVGSALRAALFRSQDGRMEVAVQP
jgi:hypothetical protein